MNSAGGHEFINLKVVYLSMVTARRLRMAATADNTLEYSATLHALPSLSNCLVK